GIRIDDRLSEINADGSLNLTYIIETAATLGAYKDFLVDQGQVSRKIKYVEYVMSGYVLLAKMGVALLSDNADELCRLKENLDAHIMGSYLSPDIDEFTFQANELSTVHSYRYTALVQSRTKDAGLMSAYPVFAGYIGLQAIGLRGSIRYNPEMNQGWFDDETFAKYYLDSFEKHERFMLGYASACGQTPKLIKDIKTMDPGLRSSKGTVLYTE
ncbi:MAG: hypothetical protein NDI94_05750, partial [Candidatus Woesearchaeota archaeon]|nr:hypothetical protein [Candidatus Woesearchaeota archaeon]